MRCISPMKASAKTCTATTGEVLPFNPTAENIARWICDHVENAYRVEVWESEMNMAAYER